MKMIPIYRLKEGREYLALNEATFDRCQEILIKNGIVLIFAEGLCMNQWKLRDLKKGAARIAVSAWSQPAVSNNFQVIPISLNYDGFGKFGKTAIIHFGKPILGEEFFSGLSEGEKINHFNQILADRLRNGMLEAEKDQRVIKFLISNHSQFKFKKPDLIFRLREIQNRKKNQLENIQLYLNLSSSIAKNWLQLIQLILVVTIFSPFAFLGWLLNIALYFPIRNFIKRKTAGTVFYDSVLFSALMLTYPLYWLIVTLIFLSLNVSLYVQIIVIALPFFAWLYIFWKDCLGKIIRFNRLPLVVKKNLMTIFN
ncbi:MAG: hypothetical protein NVSMB67_20150 [Flavisolibacter sp.]